MHKNVTFELHILSFDTIASRHNIAQIACFVLRAGEYNYGMLKMQFDFEHPMVIFCGPTKQTKQFE